MSIGVDTRSERLAQALRQHRTGDLEAARAAYSAILSDHPSDAEVTGLLGVVALQECREDEAEELLMAALDAGGDAFVRLRNLNNTLALYQRRGAVADARALVDRLQPAWPEDRVPGPDECDTLMSAAWALVGLERPEMADGLARGLPEPAENAATLALRGRIAMELGETVATSLLDRAVALDPGDVDSAGALAVHLGRIGETGAMRSLIRRLCTQNPVFSMPRQAGQQVDILMLNAIPARLSSATAGIRSFHFCQNFGAEVAQRMASEYRFHSVIVHAPPPETLPEADVIYNNCANAEGLEKPGRLERIQTVIDRLGKPVINRPEGILQTTRLANSRRLQGIDGLKVPRVQHYVLRGNSQKLVADRIEDEIGFPAILREPSVHAATNSMLPGYEVTAKLVHTRQELETMVAGCGWDALYAVEYIDLRRSDGFFRKMRASLIGDRTILTQVAFHDHWMVSGWRTKPKGIAFYRSNPETIAEANRTTKDPERYIGTAALRALDEIRERTDLEVFGVDFDVDREGRVVFFECGPAMLLHNVNDATPEDIRLPLEPFFEVDEAFRNVVRAKIG